MLDTAQIKRSSENTRKRIMKAAIKEFSTFGIAGARVDRIAQAAECNKQAIYAYYGSKEKLYEEVYNYLINQISENIPLNKDDLPGYAANITRKYKKSPEIIRLVMWARLEGKKDAPFESLVNINKKRIATIKEAQDEGIVTKKISPEDLLLLILSVSLYFWITTPKTINIRKFDDEAQIQAVREAVERLIAP